jgi:hypothetical protein
MRAGWATIGKRVAAGAVMVLAAVRVVVMVTPQIFWLVDPRAMTAPLTELGAGAAAVMNVLSVAALGLAMMVAERRRWGLAAMWSVGCVVAGWHGWGDAESLRIGFDWLAALALGLAAMHLGSDAAVRRVMVAGCLALALPVGGQAVYQVTVEHAATVENYRQNRDEILRQRGWQPGSIEQKKFEERLEQVEATARLGFSNILGTITASLSLIGIGVGIAAGSGRRGKERHTDRRIIVAVGIVTALALATLALTFSKGAAVALTAAAGLTVVVILVERVVSVRLWSAAAVSVIVIGVGVVLVRGAMGPGETAGGERSLLFRYHYWQAAAKMVVEEPVWGVGPGEFRGAYLVKKNPINPEEVTDPHNVIVAWISTLGVGGWAWTGVLVAMLLAAGRGAGAERSVVAPQADGVDLRWVKPWAIVTGVVIFGVQYAAEMERYWVDGAAIWAAGATGWIALTAWLGTKKELDSPAVRWGLFAAAICIVLQSMIEMSLTNTMSAPLLMVIIGLAAAGAADSGGRRGDGARGARGMMGMVTGVMVVVVMTVVVAVVFAWPVVARQGQVDRAAEALRSGNAAGAARWLERAGEGRAPLIEAAGDAARLWLEAGEPVRGYELLMAGVSDRPLRSAWLLQRATVLAHHVAQRSGDAAWRKRAMVAGGLLEAVDPYSAATQLLLSEVARAAGQMEAARAHDERALELDAMSYLDPNKQLDEAMRQQIRRRLEK